MKQTNMYLKIKKYKIIIIAIVLSLLWIIPSGARCSAKDIQFPVPAYSAEELNKVREWERQWAGKKIDATNIDKVAEFLPDSFLSVFKNPDVWGAPSKGFYFYISPYQQVMPTQGVIEATKKYSPKVKRNPDGSIANTAELAGVPFPEPKTGLEIAYNVDFNTFGDNAHYRMYAANINPKSKTERIADLEFLQFSYIHRTEVEPTPAMTRNPRGFHRGLFMAMRAPLPNTVLAVIESADPDRKKKGFYYYGPFRRLRDIDLQAPIDLGYHDLTYDDVFPLGVNTKRFSYEYKGTRELLSTRHQDMGKVDRQEGQALANYLNFERCKVLVIEVVNNDLQYPDGKRLWFIDPETYMILWSEIYDKSKNAMKLFIHHNKTVMSKKQLHFEEFGLLCTESGPWWRFDSKKEKTLLAANELISFPVGMTYFNFARHRAAFVDRQSKYFEPEVGVAVNVQDSFSNVHKCTEPY
jgi:hypothetical protein